MDQSEVTDSKYCRKCVSCRSWIRCETLHGLQKMFVSIDGKPLKSCQRCRDNCYETHVAFCEAGSSFLEQHDNHKFDAAVHLRLKVTLTSTFSIENDISVATCAQSGGQELQRRTAMILRKDVFDLRRILLPDGARFNLSCSRSTKRKTERDSLSIRWYTEAQNYVKVQKLFLPRQIYQNSIQMADGPQFEKTELHTITRQQKDGYRLIEGLQDPSVSLAFITPCCSNSAKYNRAKMTEVSIDSRLLYCVLTEYDLVSLPLSCLLLDTRGIQEVGKRGSRLTEWFVALRNAGLNPYVVHTDKDFAGT
ncbi:hypothetical protein V1505DRAFT_413521 [Lipomyces doorenjongii]